MLDLTNPSPALGWDLRERMSLAERGPADVVLLRLREDIFTRYDREIFEGAFRRFLRVTACDALPASGRVLYTMERQGE